MVSDAIVTLKEGTGSSQYAIRKFIQDKYKDHLPAKFKKRLSNRVKKFVASKKLVKVKAFYTLPSTAKPKPKAAANPKPAAKKALAKKKPAAKTKPDAKAKAGSAKAAAKPNLTPKSFEEAADILGG